MDFILVANRNQKGAPVTVADQADDLTGRETVSVLEKAVRLASRMTGNDKGSLGLHPAVYFYGPSGRHQSPMFMGVATLLSRKLANHDKQFFEKFTRVRKHLEEILVTNKDLIATLIQRAVSKRRIDQFAEMLEQTIDALAVGKTVGEQDLIAYSGMDGKVVVGYQATKSARFSDEAKSAIFISTALKSAIVCPICSGYLDPKKSVSFDHVNRVREGGVGSVDNGQLTHPYCNQAVKN
jgi:predicted GIY-YIG superfamily endonuclease